MAFTEEVPDRDLVTGVEGGEDPIVSTGVIAYPRSSGWIRQVDVQGIELEIPDHDLGEVAANQIARSEEVAGAEWHHELPQVGAATIVEGDRPARRRYREICLGAGWRPGLDGGDGATRAIGRSKIGRVENVGVTITPELVADETSGQHAMSVAPRYEQLGLRIGVCQDITIEKIGGHHGVALAEVDLERQPALAGQLPLALVDVDPIVVVLTNKKLLKGFASIKHIAGGDEVARTEPGAYRGIGIVVAHDAVTPGGELRGCLEHPVGRRFAVQLDQVGRTGEREVICMEDDFWDYPRQRRVSRPSSSWVVTKAKGSCTALPFAM